MIVHQFSMPASKTYHYGERGELSDSNLKDIENLGVDEIWYWYAYGDYEGSGEILMRKGDRWDVDSLSHCS
jgi:hypothetical protein